MKIYYFGCLGLLLCRCQVTLKPQNLLFTRNRYLKIEVFSPEVSRSVLTFGPVWFKGAAQLEQTSPI